MRSEIANHARRLNNASKIDDIPDIADIAVVQQHYCADRACQIVPAIIG